MNRLDLNEVSKAYGGVPALRSVSLSLAAGEIHALMGENGAGKSTLIKILAGVVAPDRAAIAIDGRPVTIDRPNAAFACGLRFIHQELNDVPTLSVAENIFLGRPFPRRLGALVDWRRLADQARTTLALLGIEHIDPRRKMARLGVGDRMLVCICAAFLDSASGTASVYVMDEPTAALTGKESERLFAVLREIRRTGRSVLYVSHRLDEVMRLCDRVTVFRDGQVIGTSDIASTSVDGVIRMMIGRGVDNAYPPPLAPAGSEVALAVEGLEGEGIGPVDLAVRRGEIVGLAGLSGAGQSDVLKLIAGAERPRRGRVHLNGKARFRRGLPASWQSGIAYVPRERRSEGLVLGHPISRNISLPHLSRLGRAGVFLDRAHESKVALEGGAAVRLKARGIGQTCRELSGGNQQKVVFAKALTGNPQVLLLDEPTRGVDVGAKFDIYSLIREASADGMAVVIASSDFPELLGLCDRIAVMRDGKVGEILGTTGLTEETLIGHCYGRANADAPSPEAAPVA